MATEKNDFEAGMAKLVQERMASGQWKVFAIAGDEGLRPVAEFLKEQFDVDDVNGIVIAVMEVAPEYRRQRPVIPSQPAIDGAREG